MCLRRNQSFSSVVVIIGLTMAAQSSAAIVGWNTVEVVKTNGVNSLWAPSVSSGSVAYTIGEPDLFPPPNYEQRPGVYVFDAGAVRTVAQAGDSAPGFGGAAFDNASFARQLAPVVSPANDKSGGGVSFLASVFQPGPVQHRVEAIFSEWSGPNTLDAVAIAGVTPVYGTSDKLTQLGIPSMAFGQTFFWGADSSGKTGIFNVFNPSQAEKLVQEGDPAPTTLPLNGGIFTGFGNFPAGDFDDRSHMFTAFLGFTSYLGGSSGIFVITDFHDAPEVVVEKGMLLPGQTTERYNQFDSSPAIDDGVVAFYGEGSEGTKGIYTGAVGTSPTVVADTHTAVPVGQGTFSGFGQLAYPSIDKGFVAFVGFDSSGTPGVYANYGGALMRVYDENYFLNQHPDEKLLSIDLFHQGLGGNKVAFRVQSADANDFFYDRILLSTAVVPVPSTLLLLILGALTMLGIGAHNKPRIKSRS